MTSEPSTAIERGAILGRLAAERQNPTVILQENSTSGTLTREQLRVLGGQQREQLARLGLTIEYSRTAAEYEARLRTRNLVGAARFVLGNESMQVTVEPKIGSESLFTVLAYAHGTPSRWQAQTRIYRRESSTIGLIVEYVVSAILDFVGGRSRYRDYQLRAETTRCPRGRLDVLGYARKSAPRLQRDRMPCSYFEFTPDVIENRILTATLTTSCRLASALSAGARRRVSQAAARARALLCGVSDLPISVEEVESVYYTRANSHFKPIHEICLLVLGGASVSLRPGRTVPFFSFAIDMGAIFEKFVKRLLRRAFGGAMTVGRRWLTFPIGRNQSIELDGLLRTTEGNVVIECKYKIVESQPSTFDEGRIRSADLYQAVAYACHRDVVARRAMLVYPAADSMATASVATTIDGFAVRDRALPVDIVLVSLLRDPEETERALRALLSRY